MTYPAITAAYAGIFALVFVAMSGWVIAGRFSFKVNLGDGGNDALAARIRAHGNFGEYVPFALLLVALLEASQTSRLVIHLLLFALLVARAAHPVGMLARPLSRRQGMLRGGGMVVTLFVLGIAGIMLFAKSIS